MAWADCLHPRRWWAGLTDCMSSPQKTAHLSFKSVKGKTITIFRAFHSLRLLLSTPDSIYFHYWASARPLHFFCPLSKLRCTMTHQQSTKSLCHGIYYAATLPRTCLRLHSGRFQNHGANRLQTIHYTCHHCYITRFQSHSFCPSSTALCACDRAGRCCIPSPLPTHSPTPLRIFLFQTRSKFQLHGTCSLIFHLRNNLHWDSRFWFCLQQSSFCFHSKLALSFCCTSLAPQAFLFTATLSGVFESFSKSLIE